jgi:hypothetical protein
LKFKTAGGQYHRNGGQYHRNIHEDSYQTFDATNSDDAGTEKTLTAKDFGEIPFAKFDIYL